MKKYLILAMAAPLVFTACSPDKGSSGDGDGGSTLKSDLVINSSNSEVIIARALSEFATTDEFLGSPAEGFTGFLITDDGTGSRMANSRAIVARIQETIACDTGTASVTSNTADVEASPFPVSGIASFEANYNSCAFVRGFD